MNFKTVTSAIALVAACVAAPTHAAILFQDNFNADYASSQLNVASLNNWTISGGTVDYLKAYPGISCVTGGCLDMDGSTGDAGRITSIATFGFLAGVSYTLEAQVSGNQRNTSTDSVIFGFFDTLNPGSPVAIATFGGIAGSQFETYSFTIGTQPGTYGIFIEGIGGDNVGVILDNVVLRDDRAAVPEPATVLLLAVALLAAGTTRRRRV